MWGVCFMKCAKLSCCELCEALQARHWKLSKNLRFWDLFAGNETLNLVLGGTSHDMKCLWEFPAWFLRQFSIDENVERILTMTWFHSGDNIEYSIKIKRKWIYHVKICMHWRRTFRMLSYYWILYEGLHNNNDFIRVFMFIWFSLISEGERCNLFQCNRHQHNTLETNLQTFIKAKPGMNFLCNRLINCNESVMIQVNEQCFWVIDVHGSDMWTQ